MKRLYGLWENVPATLAITGGKGMFLHEISILSPCRARVLIHRAKQILFVILARPKSECNLCACELSIQSYWHASFNKH